MIGACVVQTVQENTGRDAAFTGVNYQKAVVPYSAGQWIAQANSASPTLDLRNGFRLGGVASVCGVPAGGTAYTAQFSAAGTWSPTTNATNGGIVTVANADLARTTDDSGCAVRFLYNVTNTANPQNNLALGLVGAASPLCADSFSTGIRSFGFAPIPAASATEGTSCRIY
jgi:hypothetical protein